MASIKVMNMIHNQFDLNLVMVLDALIRERSTTRAAEQLGLGQSAVSHALGRLRRALDDPLFIKTAGGLKPTPRTEALTPAVLQMMEIVRNELHSQPRFDPARVERCFRFCMTDMGELVFLPPLMERLRREAPHCTLQTLQVPQARIAETLESGEADLAIGSLRAIPQGLFQQQLFTHPFVTIVATEAPVGERLTLAEFEAMDHVVVSLDGGRGSAYDKAIEELGVRRRIFLTTPHFLLIPPLLERQPNLVATVPRELGTVFARYKVVRVVEPPIGLPRFELRQHWHPRFHYDPANLWLRKLVKETFADYPE